MAGNVPAAERLDTLPPGIPDRTLGWEALAFAAKYLRHVDGDRAGKRWEFTPRQAKFILWHYAIDEDGNWLYGHSARRLAKGSGKSPWAAVMAIIEFLGPVRLDHLDDEVLGGCVGKRVPMSWVQLAAVSEKQTENAMIMVRSMMNKHNAPKLHEDFELDLGKTQMTEAAGSKLEVITASPASAEGSRATCILVDETEHWLPSTGGVALFDTLVDNLAKTGNRVIETLNAWIPDVGSVAERTFDEWTAQEDNGQVAKQGILYDSVMAPLDTDLTDEDSLRAALEFVYEDCPWSLKTLDSVISRIQRRGGTKSEAAESRSTTALESAKRKYLNWPTAADDAWADPRRWANMADRSRVVAEGEEIVMFFDGSLTRDATALIGCAVDDGHVFVIGIWDPTNSHDHSGIVSREAVDAKVDWAFSHYHVRAFFADVQEWQGYIQTIWADRYRDRLDVWAKPRGEIPEPIAWDMRGHKKDFTLACELTEAEIFEGEFTHDGNALLARHVANARRRENNFGVDIVKESKNSARKIDAAIAMIGARHALRVLKENASSPMTYEAFFI